MRLISALVLKPLKAYHDVLEQDQRFRCHWYRTDSGPVLAYYVTGCSIMFCLCFQHWKVGLQPKQTCSFPQPGIGRGWWYAVREWKDTDTGRDNETFGPRKRKSEQNPVHLITNTLWWRHQIETFSVLLAPCEGSPSPPVDSPRKG